MSIKNTSNGKSISQDFNDMARDFEKFVSEELPLEILEAAETLVQDSFEKEQFKGNMAASKWKGRKNDKDSKKARTKRRGLLVKSGELVRSTGAERRGENIVIYADKVYAQRHNEGIKMPKRQFMPIPGEESPVLTRKINEVADKGIDKIFK